MRGIIAKLAELFTHYPGIGPRQAKRFVYFLLRADKAYVDNLLHSIQELRDTVSECTECHSYFTRREKIANLECDICSDPHRNLGVLIVVEKDVDLDNIEKTGSFAGKYFVLGGLLPILEKEPERCIRIRELIQYIKTSDNISEIILALSANQLGDNTTQYIKDRLEKDVNKQLKISLLGRGLSTGTELEYSDASTLSSALANRK